MSNGGATEMAESRRSTRIRASPPSPSIAAAKHCALLTAYCLLPAASFLLLHVVSSSGHGAIDCMCYRELRLVSLPSASFSTTRPTLLGL